MKELQIVCVFCFLSITAILFLNLDYARFIDPKYYSAAAVQSIDFENAIQANKAWIQDVLFVFLISLLGMTGADEVIVFVFFVLLHFLILLCIALSAKNKKVLFLFIVCSTCNLSFVTGVLNVWRQSLVELIFVLSFIRLSQNKSSKILFLSTVGFHLVSAFYFNLVSYISSKGWKLIVLAFLFIIGAFFAFSEYIYTLQRVAVYSNSNHINNYNRLAVVFVLLAVGLKTRPKNKYSTYLIAIITVIFISNLALYQVVPSATNRLLRIVFTIFPVIYLFSTTRREVIVSSIVLVLYLVLNIFLIAQSNTYKLMYLL